MLSNEKVNFTDKEIIEKGSRALIKELGYSGFLRFIRQIDSNGDNYFEIQEDLYKGISLDMLFNEAEKHWNTKDK